MATNRFSGLSETRKINTSSFSNNVAVAALIGAFAVCGCKNGNTATTKDYPLKDQSSLSGGMDGNQNTPDVIDQKEDIADAIKSAGGSIHKRVRYNDGGTVIFIADHHKNMSRPTADQYRVQNEVFSIVKNVANGHFRGGSIPLVIENWPEGMSRSDLFSKLGKTHPLYVLFSTPGNSAAAAKALDGSTANATTVLSGYFADRLYPVGTVSNIEMREADELIADDTALTNLQNRNAEFCALQNGKRVSPREAKSAFLADNDGSSNECYCALNYFESDIIERLKWRLNSIPQREAQIAISQTTDGQNGMPNITIMVAGLRHMETVLEVFEERRINFISVLPNTVKKNRDRLLEHDVFNANFPDDRSGTCESLINDNRQRILSIIDDIKRI